MPKAAAGLLNLLVLTCALLFPSDLSAQAGGTAMVSGRVENAVSGSALNLARVTVAATGQEVFTNEYGEYFLSGLPAGRVELIFSYTGMASQTVAVELVPGASVVQDVRLTTSRLAAAMKDGETVVLDPFTVAAERDTNAASIAANEQRYAASIKNVVAADAFGDVTEGNIGEFMKFLPGITVDYVAADVRTMSVRGFADNFTSISVNGARMASSSSGASSRSFEFEQVSINNVARVEVSKAPLPSMPADSLGGAVNMVSKNAFERKGAEFKYKLYLNANHEDLQVFRKTPGPLDEPTRKILPGFDFDYTLPISKTFGIVVTGLVSNQYNEQHRSQKTYNFAQAGATAANPYLQSYLFQDGPKNTFRRSGSAKFDWKIASNQVLSGAVQANYYLSQFGNRNFTYNVGTSATSTPSGGTPLTWGQDWVSGATGRGTVQGQTSFRDKYGATTAGNVNWRYTGPTWEIDASLNGSASRTWYRDTGRGHFSEVRTNMLNVSRIEYRNIDQTRPQEIYVYNAAGELLDPTDLSNYRVSYGRGNPIDARDEFIGGAINFKYSPNLPIPVSLKAGLDQRNQTRDIRRWDESWNLAGTVTGTDWVDTEYLYQDPFWGLPFQEWPDPYALYDLKVTTPTAYAQTADQALAAERFRRQNSQYLEEKITAAYVQAEAKLLHGSLGLVTGVRFEKTEDDGVGPLTRGPITTMELLQANFLERAYSTSTSYDGYYPSFHANYSITPDLIARFAYSTSLGRPDFADILPLARVNYSETSINDGIGTVPAQTVIVTNTQLKPWEADSFDLSLEYYFPNGGVVSGGYFAKNLTDFWGTSNSVVTAADVAQHTLDPSTIGLNLQYTLNIGDAKITGFELSYQQSLGILSDKLKDFSIFANGTKLDLSGPNNADFAKFIEESASWGITYGRKPVVLALKWNYRGRQRLDPQTGNAYGGAAGGFTEYYAPRTFLDLNVEFQLSKRLTIFGNARNILNKQQILQRYNELSPAYSHDYRMEEYGIQMNLGIKGTF